MSTQPARYSSFTAGPFTGSGTPPYRVVPRAQYRGGVNGKTVKDNWEHGDAYELFIGRWSSLVAVEFLNWLELPGGLRWVDVGCGTGALSEAILDSQDPTSVDGVEPSAGFVRAAGQRLGDRARVHQAPAEHLPLPEGAADVVVSGLVLNFIPDLPAALAEMKRVAPDGVVAAYVWDYSGGMQMLRLFWEAAAEVDPDGNTDEDRRFPICRPEALSAAFVDAGLDDPRVVALDIPTPFPDFEALWMPFTGGQGAGPSYLVSLPAAKQDALKASLRGRVPTNADGSISLTARAWAVRATA
jgi:SAM-dependent methyltransferase